MHRRNKNGYASLFLFQQQHLFLGDQITGHQFIEVKSGCLTGDIAQVNLNHHPHQRRV